jgi:predicted nucleotidyltransferase
MNLARVEPARLDIVDRVVGELIDDGTILPETIMLLRAECRDILHRAHGHAFDLRGTSDVDVGLAIDDWDAHDAVLRRFAPTGDTGIRYRISGMSVDIMPFGSIEQPRGEVSPNRRPEDPFSVFAFQEVFLASLPLQLPSGNTIRIPTAPGYSALKLRAWRDRWTTSLETKDGPDIATIVYWYSEDEDVYARLWETADGVSLLESVEFDYPVGAAQLLGKDTIELIGAERANELRTVWNELDLDALAKVFGDSALPGWPTDRTIRRAIVNGLTTGLFE